MKKYGIILKQKGTKKNAINNNVIRQNHSFRNTFSKIFRSDCPVIKLKNVVT